MFKKTLLPLILILLTVSSAHAQSEYRTNFIPSEPPTFVTIFLLETTAMITSFGAHPRTGAQYVGGFYLLAAGTAAGYMIYDFESTIPEFTLPFTIGLATLGYYNFRYLDDHSGNRRILYNFVGLNAAFFGSYFVARMYDTLGPRHRNSTRETQTVEVYPGLSTMTVRVNF